MHDEWRDPSTQYHHHHHHHHQHWARSDQRRQPQKTRPDNNRCIYVAVPHVNAFIHCIYSFRAFCSSGHLVPDCNVRSLPLVYAGSVVVIVTHRASESLPINHKLSHPCVDCGPSAGCELNCLSLTE